MNVLLLNAGSSSLKTTLLSCADRSIVAKASADWASAPARYRFVGPDGEERSVEMSASSHAEATRRSIDDFARALGEESFAESLRAVGHRVVHGGERAMPTPIAPSTLARIRELADFAPLHNAAAADVIEAAQQRLPRARHIALFDTAFHATLPPAAYTYAVPRRWETKWGVRRYGFHGLNHAYCARRAAELLSRPVENLRLVVLHLGHGCSASAVAGGRCVDTSMGFTPLDGLVMATRSGAVDPSAVLHVMKREGRSPEEMDAALNRESGLLGVSELSSDMRTLLRAAQEGHARSRLAVDVYVHRIRQCLGAYAAVLGGLDAVVFTAGVGENSAAIRAAVCDRFGFLGLSLDSEANQRGSGDRDISADGAPVRALVIAAGEDLQMLHEIERWIDSSDNETRAFVERKETV